MDFYEVLNQIHELLRRRGRVAYRALQRQFDLADKDIEALKDELIYAQQVAADEDNRVLVWAGDNAQASSPSSSSPPQDRDPASYTPQHLAEKILTSRGALEGERKQVTVMFADIKDSTELIRDLDPEAAQQLLDPAIHIMMDTVHRFEGTVSWPSSERRLPMKIMRPARVMRLWQCKRQCNRMPMKSFALTGLPCRFGWGSTRANDAPRRPYGTDCATW